MSRRVVTSLPPGEIRTRYGTVYSIKNNGKTTWGFSYWVCQGTGQTEYSYNKSYESHVDAYTAMMKFVKDSNTKCNEVRPAKG
jgi:hypothetical protein